MDDRAEMERIPASPTARPIPRRPRRVWLILLALAGIGAWYGRWGPAIANEYQFHRAISILDAGKSEEAAATLELMIEGKPRETRARLALARAYRQLGRITEAEETLQRAVELGLPIEQARAEHNQINATRMFEPPHLTDR